MNFNRIHRKKSVRSHLYVDETMLNVKITNSNYSEFLLNKIKSDINLRYVNQQSTPGYLCAKFFRVQSKGKSENRARKREVVCRSNDGALRCSFITGTICKCGDLRSCRYANSNSECSKFIAIVHVMGAL